MSSLIPEALAIGAKEGINVMLVWLVLCAFALRSGLPRISAAYLVGVAVAISSAFVIAFFPFMFSIKSIVFSLAGYVFFVFFFLSVVLLFDLLPSAFRLSGRFSMAVLLLLTVIYFIPEMSGVLLYLKGMSAIKESPFVPYIAALAGFIPPLIVFAFKPDRLIERIAGYMGLGQVFLSLSIIKLAGGGIRGFSEISLIPYVQSGVMKLVHDVVHQTFVFLLVPDHKILSTTTWSFIGVFFGSNIALGITLCLLVGPPLFYIYRTAVERLPEPDGSLTGAQRRMFGARVRADRRRMAIIPAFAVLFILVLWFLSGSDEVSSMYNPRPKPVVDDKGVVMIPLSDPTMNLADGEIHKFSVTIDNVKSVFFVIRKPDGRLAVCLDACEICPPVGYGQTTGNVVCIYCKTPIPIDTLGRPGGCNPIPLPAVITEREIRVNLVDIEAKRKEIRGGSDTGKGGEK